MTKDKLIAEIQRLIKQGNEEVLVEKVASAVRDVHRQFVMAAAPLHHHKWLSSCRNLLQTIGERESKPWSIIFEPYANEDLLPNVKARIGALQSLEHAIQHDLLLKVEDFIRAEALGGIMDQAAYLLDQGFHVPAAVLCRCILEEHLRNVCIRHACAPTVPKPTLNHYIQSLYSAKIIDKLKLKHVEDLTAIGNAAAHAQPIKPEDAKRLLDDLPGFLVSTT